MSRQPYIPFYVGDYLKDTRILPLAVRGAWVDLILFMWDAPIRGEITGTIEDFARLMSCDRSEAEFALNLLKQKSTADFFLLDTGEIKIVSRKMKRDYDISKKRSEAGRNGVEAKKNKEFASAKQQANSKQNTENENTIGIKIQKEICKIFGKDYLPAKDRLPALANWFSTIDYQAKILYDTYGEEQAISQIKAYVIHCKATDRKLIGTNYKVAETILSSDWVQLTGGHPAKPPNKYETAEERKRDWTKEAWEERYEKQLRNDNEFRKHFGYAELRSSAPVGSNGQR